MNHFTAADTLLIVGMVVAYILFTTWLTFRLRSKNNGDFMEAPNPSDQAKLEVIHYLVNKIIEKREVEDLDNDLPF